MQESNEIEYEKFYSLPQLQFIDTEVRFPAFVAGLGSGKSTAAVDRMIDLKLESPECNVAYYMPTYDLIQKVAYPKFEEALIEMGLTYKINKHDKEIKLPGYGIIILRTMDRPERIIGYEVADSMADELDTLPKEKAADVWKKILARNRQKKANGKKNTVGVATTPEGFRFVYDRWHKRGNDDYKIIKASTYSNAHNLPEDYISTLEEDYPAQLLQAYLHGDFVNLANQSVYPEFDREKNSTTATMDDGEPLHIGMDFNVGKMAAVVHVVRGNTALAVGELTDYLDTPRMIIAIKEKFPNRTIYIYPDASGQARKTVNASESDIALLKQAGFIVMVNSTNPFVRDRVLSVNVKLKKLEYLINIDLCPQLVDALEQQAYDKNGEPDKDSGIDHVIDGAGYFITYKFPISYGSVGMFAIKGN